jgi:integrase/recombinase XerD
VFGARRADIECFARHLESLGWARATIARRLWTGGLLLPLRRTGGSHRGLGGGACASTPARPRVPRHATGLDRNEVGAMLVAAGVAGSRDHALIRLLALNGLRVSEAVGANIEDLGLERGHRTLTILRKGGKVVTIPWHRGRPGPSIWRSANAATGRTSSDPMGSGSTDTRPAGSCAASPDGRGSPSA